MDYLSLEAWSALLGSFAELLLWGIPGLLAYGFLANSVLFEAAGRVRYQRFGFADVMAVGIVTLLFLSLVANSVSAAKASVDQSPTIPDAGSMVMGILSSEVLFLGVLAGLMAGLHARGIDLRATFGLDRLPPGRILVEAVVLLLLALPLILLALKLSWLFVAGLGYGNSDEQDAVRFLAKNHSVGGRVAVVISAVVLAPFQEELIFRGYLYAVLRRYIGVGAAAVASAGLFALIHLNAPSFAGLFVLAVCLSLAYEWSGSILVPMAMHALFNSLTVYFLLTGN